MGNYYYYFIPFENWCSFCFARGCGQMLAIYCPCLREAIAITDTGTVAAAAIIWTTPHSRLSLLLRKKHSCQLLTQTEASRCDHIFAGICCRLPEEPRCQGRQTQIPDALWCIQVLLRDPTPPLHYICSWALDYADSKHILQPSPLPRISHTGT